jgi:putative ABC transport system ATP-binding protein
LLITLKSSSESSNPIIVLQGVSKVFGRPNQETRALSNVNLRVNRGEYVAITGPSGGGKSTLLSIMGLLDEPSEGRYVLCDRPVESLSMSERAFARNSHLGFVFQAFNLIDDLTVFENVELPLVYRNLAKADRRLRVEQALKNVGLDADGGSYPRHLSGGQQQRVSMARAVVGEPAIVLADEPTGNLDSTNGRTIMDLLAKLHHRGTTICLVTHDAEFARCASRQISLFDGEIVP